MKTFKLLCILLTVMLLFCACNTGDGYGEIETYSFAYIEDADPDDNIVDISRSVIYVGGHTVHIDEKSIRDESFSFDRKVYLYDLRTGKKSEDPELPQISYASRVYDDAHFVVDRPITNSAGTQTHENYEIYDLEGKLVKTYSWDTVVCPYDDPILKNVYRQPNGIFTINWCYESRFRSEYDIYAQCYSLPDYIVAYPLDKSPAQFNMFERTEGAETWEEYFIQPYNEMYDLVTAIVGKGPDDGTWVQYKHALRHKTEGTYTFGELTDLRVLYALGDGRLLMANKEETVFYLASVGEDLMIGEPQVLAECGKNSVFAFSPDEKLFAIAEPDTTDGVVTSVKLSLYDIETAKQIVSRQLAVDASHGIEFAKTPTLSYRVGAPKAFQGQFCVTQNGTITLRLPGKTHEHVWLLSKEQA